MYGYIYLIVNKVNGKTYVGKHKSKNFHDNYMGSGPHVKNAQKKYGLDNFEKYLIQYCSDLQDLNKAECFWIAEYKSRGKAEYNHTTGGDGFTGNHSEKTKKHFREIRKGCGMPSAALAKVHTPEAEKKKSETMKMLYATGQRTTNFRGNTYRKGVKLTDDEKEKISERTKEAMKKVPKDVLATKSKPIKCINDGHSFGSAVECSKFYFGRYFCGVNRAAHNGKPYKGLYFSWE